jgi:arylsulfatase A-like enzyme/tetratricopeptide (TPR) repeat protein
MSKKKRSRNKKAQAAKAKSAAPRPEAMGAAQAPVARSGGDPRFVREPRRGLRKFLPAVLALAVILVGGGLYLLLKPAAVPIVRNDKLNVLLITLDTTRADRLGAYGYAKAKTPNLDSIARNGVRFANAYAQVPLTLPSHTSIMTGTYPLTHGVHNNGAYVLPPGAVTLAKVLKDKGLKTAAFVASFSVDSRFGLNQGFDVYDDNFQSDAPFKAANAERKAEQVYGAFLPWFDKLKDEQFFCWLHFFDPHLPYNPPSPYREQFADRLYDGEVAYMDYIVGLVMRKLLDRNLLGKTLIVVAADHGEAFGEKGESGHGVFLYDNVLRVPLLLYAENHLPPGKVVEPRVRLIDIMPTVLDLMNVPKPAAVQGRSLLPYIQRKEKADLDSYIETSYPKENFGWAPLVGLISGVWKYIRAPREELYDLKADPGEDRNAFASSGRTAAGLKQRLDDLIRTAVVPGVSAKQALTTEEISRLRSLGYVDYSDPTARGAAADPKDKVGELKMIQDAERLEFEGNFPAAADLHEKMLALRPGAASSYVGLALARARLKDFDAAVAVLKRGTEKIPNSELLMFRLGYTYLVMGRIPDAQAEMEKVLALNPRSVDALTAMSVLLDGTGRKDEARAYFERALAVEPENSFLRMSYGQNLASAGRVSEAVDVFTKLTQEFPTDGQAWQLLGVTYAMIGDFDKAIDNLKQVLYIKPMPQTFYYLAMSYKEKGDLAESIRYLERYLEDPKDEPAPRVRNARAGIEAMRKALNK